MMVMIVQCASVQQWDVQEPVQATPVVDGGDTLPPMPVSTYPGYDQYQATPTLVNRHTPSPSHLTPYISELWLSVRFGNSFYIVDSDILFIAKQLPFYTQNRWLVLDKTLLEIMVYLYILVFSNFLIAGRSRWVNNSKIK